MTLLAPAECLLGLTSDLAAFKRVFVFDELALREVVKSAKCALRHSDQRNKSGLQCAGCLGVSAGMFLLKHFFQ